MSIQLKTATTLHRYADRVVDRSNHHAVKVLAVFPALLGYIMTYADPGSIKVRETLGETANMGWAIFGGRRIAFVYNHKLHTIEAREGTLRGTVLQSFDNRTTLRSLQSFFSTL